MDAITLDQSEQQIVRYMADARHKCARDGGIKNGRMGPQSDADTDLNGFGAEMAFCKLMNCYPDFSVSVRKGGHDLALNSLTVDVKQTCYPDGRLLVHIDKTIDDSDAYVLMTGTFPTYTYRGWIPCYIILSPRMIIDLGHGRGYGMSQEALWHKPITREHFYQEVAV